MHLQLPTDYSKELQRDNVGIGEDTYVANHRNTTEIRKQQGSQ